MGSISIDILCVLIINFAKARCTEFLSWSKIILERRISTPQVGAQSLINISRLTAVYSWINSIVECQARPRLDSGLEASECWGHHLGQGKSFPMGQLPIIAILILAWVECNWRADLWCLLSRPESWWLICRKWGIDCLGARDCSVGNRCTLQRPLNLPQSSATETHDRRRQEALVIQHS